MDIDETKQAIRDAIACSKAKQGKQTRELIAFLRETAGDLEKADEADRELWATNYA